MTSTSPNDQPLIGADERIVPAAENRELLRRVADMPPAARRLDWDEDGTPLPASSVVYLFRALDKDFPLWDEIKTRERLQLVQEAPDRFELRTLFTVPVDEVSRSPLVTVLSALSTLDRARQERNAAASRLRDALAALGEMP